MTSWLGRATATCRCETVVPVSSLATKTMLRVPSSISAVRGIATSSSDDGNSTVAVMNWPARKELSRIADPADDRRRVFGGIDDLPDRVERARQGRPRDRL